jgi:diadenosine tetraphosphate (Ap4A) HIT family hydrolase
MANGKIESAKFWENKEFFAVLDINPNVKGMTLVLTKKHYPSYAFDLPENVYKRLMVAAKKVAKILDEKLGVKRTAMIMEGMGIDHAHIKLYPLHGLNKKFEEMWSKERVYFDRYKGYLTTQLGPKADPKELKKLVDKLKK